AGPVAVRVTTSAGTSAVVSTSTFTYTAVAPAVPSVQDVSGTIAADTTWGPDRAKVYRVTGDVTVAAGATLTLLPGTVVKLGSGRTIVVDGTLAAPGTAASPVAITSDRDDGAAGDTNGDGTATAAGAGDHLGLSVRSTGALALQHTRVAFADTAITATGTTGALPVLDLTTTAISGSTQCIRAVGPVDGSFSGSVRDCQVGISSDFAFDARGVDWGSTSGPAPYGTGIAVEGLSVRVIPWSGYTAPARPALAAPQATPAATTCADVVFLGARGSGELPDSPDPTVPPLFDSDASGFGPYNYVAATKIAEELAVSRPSTTVSYLAVQYLALRAPSYDPRVGYEAYLASVYDGVDKLGQLFATESARCPDSSFVLLGTSQGALVIDLVLDSLTRVEQQDRIAGVVLLANPGRTVGAPGTLWETSDQPAGPGVADVDGIWRDFSPEIDTPLPSWAASRTISLCHQDDVVCAFRPGASVDPHSSYTLAEMHSLALWQASRIAAALPPA
uniref:cutinase family protein n=1 Tax=Aeromicrobium sp. Leaf350 TaxID=2876565 RepID=UPI001E594B81